MIAVRAAFALAFIVLGAAAGADEPSRWRVDPVATPGAVAEIRPQAGSPAIRIGRAWYRASACPQGICLAPGREPERRRPAAGGLPDGWRVHAEGTGAAEAWYAEPTRRYDHGILGDAIEAGALHAVDHRGAPYVLRLPPDLVFEDIVPRIADIDGDGSNDIVTIRSSLARGAAIAVYGVGKGRLRERAASPPIGRSHRWLNVAAIADVDGDGTTDIAVVRTPHIGGTLEIWSWRGGGLKRIAAADGYSNHAIGSRFQGLSAIADIDGDGLPELALPDTGRHSLVVVAVRDGRIAVRARVPLGGRVVHDIAVIPGARGPAFLVGLDDGRLVAVTR